MLATSGSLVGVALFGVKVMLESPAVVDCGFPLAAYHPGSSDCQLIATRTQIQTYKESFKWCRLTWLVYSGVFILDNNKFGKCPEKEGHCGVGRGAHRHICVPFRAPRWVAVAQDGCGGGEKVPCSSGQLTALRRKAVQSYCRWASATC